MILCYRQVLHLLECLLIFPTYHLDDCLVFLFYFHHTEHDVFKLTWLHWKQSLMVHKEWGFLCFNPSSLLHGTPLGEVFLAILLVWCHRQTICTHIATNIHKLFHRLWPWHRWWILMYFQYVVTLLYKWSEELVALCAHFQCIIKHYRHCRLPKSESNIYT